MQLEFSYIANIYKLSNKNGLIMHLVKNTDR